MLGKWNAVSVYLTLSGGMSLCFSTYAVMSMVYMVKTVGLNPLQLVLVGTVLELTAFLCEVPTGVVADVYSRRLSIIIGTVMIGFGLAFTGFFALFGTILLAQVIWGMGYTFTSGATQAWIVDEVGEEHVGKVFMRASQISNISAFVGIILGTLMATISIVLPILVGGFAVMGIGVLLILVMPETNFHPTPRDERGSFGAMQKTFSDGLRLVRGSPLLIMLLLIELVNGAYSEGFDRLWTAHLIENFEFPRIGGLDSVVWFGIISAVSMLLSVVMTEVMSRRLKTTNQRMVSRVLGLQYGLVIVGIIGFALTHSFWVALAAYWLAGIARTTAGPLFETWLNLNVESQVRATVISMSSQVNAFAQFGCGPAVGWVGTRFSLRHALVLSGVILSPTLWLLGRSRQSMAGEATTVSEAVV